MLSPHTQLHALDGSQRSARIPATLATRMPSGRRRDRSPRRTRACRVREPGRDGRTHPSRRRRIDRDTRQRTLPRRPRRRETGRRPEAPQTQLRKANTSALLSTTTMRASGKEDGSISPTSPPPSPEQQQRARMGVEQQEAHHRPGVEHLKPHGLVDAHAALRVGPAEVERPRGAVLGDERFVVGAAQELRREHGPIRVRRF